MNRFTQITIHERSETNTEISVNSTEPVDFSLAFQPKRFPDPRVSELEGLLKAHALESDMREKARLAALQRARRKRR